MNQRAAPPLVAAFQDPSHARAALEELLALGIPHDAISVIANNADEAEELAHEAGGDDRLDAKLRNNRLSDLVGFLSGLGALIVPGVGPDVATGTLATSLNASEAGAGRGGLAGALVGQGLSVDTAGYYDDQLAAGHVIAVVHAGSHADAARVVLQRQALPAPGG